MPSDRLHEALARDTAELEAKGTAKGAEKVITQVLPAAGGLGPRYRLAGQGDKPFLKMNSNNYLGLSLHPRVIAAEEKATAAFGAGPGAVRFISGSFEAHLELERRLAAFHGREAGMILSSAYATSLGVLVPLASADTAFVSDELNHNCIINAMRLARPHGKFIYRHNDMENLEAKLKEAADSGARRCLVVSDGVFSMRGDYAPVPKIQELARKHDDRFPENVAVVMDDSHGVGTLGASGRGTEELTGDQADVLIATLGKALGVNGGYVVGSSDLIRYLRETAPMYIYSNPITPGEAVAATQSLSILDSDEGKRLLAHLRKMTEKFEKGLLDLGYETIPGPHPVTPLMVRDTPKTSALVRHLFDHGVLATGLNYPVVPKGDESIRFQIAADHTPADIDQVLGVLESFPGRG